MSSTRRTIGLASVPERVLLLLNSGLGHRGLSVAVAALSRFVVAKSVLGRPVVVEGRGASSCRAHAFAVCVVEQSTGQLQFATEFTTDTDAVLAALAGVSLPVTIGSAGDGTPGVGNAVDVSPTALDLSQLLQYPWHRVGCLRGTTQGERTQVGCLRLLNAAQVYA